MTTMWFAKFSWAPHRVQLSVGLTERVKFWWSYFPANFSADRGLFDYWGDDVGELRFLWKYLEPGMTFVDIGAFHRSEEHTSELQSQSNLVCRLLLEKKKIKAYKTSS